jgi:hypothetical protein
VDSTFRRGAGGKSSGHSPSRRSERCPSIRPHDHCSEFQHQTRAGPTSRLMNRPKPGQDNTLSTTHVSLIPSNPTCCRRLFAGPDRSLQFPDPTDRAVGPDRVPRPIGRRRSPVRSIRARLLQPPSKTWPGTPRLPPRRRRIEFSGWIRRRGGSKVAK